MIKENKKTRCPWCGEIYRKSRIEFMGKYNLKRMCRNCNRYAAPIDEFMGIFDRWYVLIIYLIYIWLGCHNNCFLSR